MTKRRHFLAAASAALVPNLRGASGRVNLAMIGLGGRGMENLKTATSLPDCQIVALCDVNQAARESAAAFVQRANRPVPKAYADPREVFADSAVDAVSIATPNHWHALATIWACQAGKDVYVEKPVSHNIDEGRAMVAAAKRFNRIVQCGTQSRSMTHIQTAVRLLHEGVIGKVYMARGLCFKRRPSIGRTPVEAVPPGVDWDRFLGPAAYRPFTKNRFRYNWHWFWETGNGDLGNQGAHQMDIASWGLNKDGVLPERAYSSGGKFVYDDDQETPNTQSVLLDYGDCQLSFEVRGLISGGEGGLTGANTVGNLFFGTDGYLSIGAAGFRIYRGEKKELVHEGRAEAEEDAPHLVNFLDAVRTRRVTSLSAPIEVGAHTAALCHLGNISYRVGRGLTIDRASGRVLNDPEASALFTRDYRKPYGLPGGLV